jgi:hypothetical protein
MQKPTYAPSAWCLVLGPCGHGISFYTLYYTETAGSGLLGDTPAIDAKGRFLWCANARKLEDVHDRVVKKLARLGVTKTVTGTIDVGKVLSGLESEKEPAELWGETIDLLNVIIDYLVFLPNDSEDKDTIMLLGDFSDHIFEGKALPQFYRDHDTSKRHIIQIVLHSLHRIFENSVII